MPEYSRPNLSIPSTLWGEVKVAAFRSGKRPQDLVIECLQEKYDDEFRQSKGLPSRASVQRLRDKVAKLGEPVVEPPKPPAPSPQPELKDGYGWCRVCEKNQVKLPHFLCSTCQKP